MYPTTSDRAVVDFEVPLAPLAEQRRIVAKVETLLGKLDACQRRLAKIPTLLERFRQSVLATACSGRLTADWRKQSGIAHGSEQTTIGAIASYTGGFAYKSSTFLGEGEHQVIRIANVRPLALKLDAAPVFIPEDIARHTERFRVLPGDILISMTGTKYKQDYGNAALVANLDGSLFLNQRVARLRCGEKTIPEFLLLWLQTDSFREFFFAGETGNVNQGNVAAGGIRNAPIELPSLIEQREIVRRVDALLGLADQLDARLANAQMQVNGLGPSLIDKAFRGELVPNEAKLAQDEGRSYEPANTLLGRIGVERKTAGATDAKARARRVRR